LEETVVGDLVDFNKLCDHIMMEEYLTEKYPTMNLYNKMFSLPYIN